MADPTNFTIVELTGDRRTLSLGGRCLPYKPYSLKGKMRAEFTWYPGNAVASTQVLGAQEAPTTIRGQWKDKFVRSVDDEGFNVIPTGIAELNASQLADVMAIVTAVDSIRRGGQLLEVTWDAIVRRGLLTDFTHSWNRREWCEWEMEFTWISQGEDEQPITFAQPADANTFAGQLKNLVNNLEAQLAPAFQLVEDFSSTLNGYVAQITSASDQLTELASSVAAAAFTPQEAAERTLAAAESVKENASGIVTLVESTNPRDVIAVASPDDLGLGAVLDVDVYTRQLKVTSRSMVSLASENADTLRASIRQEELLATFVARQPTDLRQVSQIYYDTPDEWRRLLQYNQLTSSKLERGALVLVPKIDSADRGA